MKKTISVLLIALLSLTCVFAGDFKFVFKDLDQHPDILYGFLPTLAEVGVGYDGFSLFEGKTTELQVTAGGGFTQRNLFQDPTTGDQMTKGFLTYNTTQYRLNLKINQSLNDTWTAYAGYEARYEVNTDAKQSIDSWFNLKPSTIYPDVSDDKKAFLNTLYAGIIFDRMNDTIVTTDGFLGEFNYQYGSSFINKDALFGSTTLNLVAAKTLYQKTNEDNENRYSVVIIDRFNFNRTDGTKVPAFISRPVSLGRKVRGFDTNTYNTDRSVVNNLELRLSAICFARSATARLKFVRSL